MHLVPTVIEKTNQREYAYDIYSRLLEDRIILLTGTIDDKMSQQYCWSASLFRIIR